MCSTQVWVLLSYVCSDVCRELQTQDLTDTACGISPVGLLRADSGVSLCSEPRSDPSTAGVWCGSAFFQATAGIQELCSSKAVLVVISLEVLREEGGG